MKVKGILIAAAALLFAASTAYAVTPNSALEYGNGLVQGGWWVDKCQFIDDPVDNTNQCMKMRRTNNDNTTPTWLEFDNRQNKKLSYNIEGRFSLSFRLYFYNDTVFRVQLYGLQNGANKEISSFYTNSGSFYIGAHRLVTDCTAEKWHNIELIVDTDKNTVTANIDGEQACAAEELSTSLFATADTENLHWFRFLIESNQSNVNVLLDDVKIKSLRGIADKLDASSAMLEQDGVETLLLTPGAHDAALAVNVRTAGTAAKLVAAVYGENGELTEIKTADALSTGKHRIEIGTIPQNTRLLRCFVWEKETLRPAFVQTFNNGHVKATDYGVYPEKESGTETALQTLIDSMPDGGVIELDPGRYLLEKPVGEKYCININRKNNLTILGNGAELVVDSFTNGFAKITDSEGVTVKDISVNWRVKPWEQGTVTAMNEENCYFDMRVSDNGGIFDTELYKKTVANCFMMIMNSENPNLIKSTANEHYLADSITPLGNSTYRIYVSDWSANAIFGYAMGLGDKIILNARAVSGSAFYLKNCGNTVLRDISVKSSGECGVKGVRLSGDLLIDGLNMSPDENRWICSNADGIHIQLSRGKLTLVNSVFNGLSDDCINLYQTPITVSGIEGAKLTISENSLRAGDSVAVFNYDSGKIKGTYTAVSASSGSLTLDKTAENISPGDCIYIANAMFDGSRIENNRFINSRRYGLLLKCSGIQVIENEFTNLGSDAITAYYSSGEGLWLRNASFNGNRITNCGYLRNGRQAQSGAFSIKSVNTASDTIHSNITFSGNIITGAPKCGFYLNSIDGVTVDATNKIIDLADGTNGVTVSNCKNVSIDENMEMSYETSTEKVINSIN